MPDNVALSTVFFFTVEKKGLYSDFSIRALSLSLSLSLFLSLYPSFY